ncbi:phosphate transport system permease protein PstA 1 [Actinomycetota bacterium]|nr:phosphate transport system permease protein PstA 1 [Actinomycetota bacterium]
MTQSTIPKPQMPWGTSKAQRMATASLLVLAGLLAGAAIELTGLSGKLGFAAAYFFFASLVIFAQQLRLRDLAAAKDSLLSSFALLAMTITLIPIVSIVSTVVLKGYKGIHFGMFTNDMTQASVNDPVQAGGLLHALVGTIIMVGGALIVSFPIGLLTALYLTEIRGKLARPIKFLVQAMSGVPSIVAGLFILSILVIPITQELNGLMGSLALSILMIPTIARTAEEMLLLIPNELREAGVALGATQWRTVSGVVVPAAKSGLVTAVILGIARIIGETAPILLVSGGADALNFNPTSGPMGSLPFYIWKAFLTGGTEEAYARAWGGMLILLILIFVLFGLARYLSGRRAV